MENRTPCAGDIAQAKTVHITQSAPVMIASIGSLITEAEKLCEKGDRKGAAERLQKVRRIVFSGLKVFGPDFPGGSFSGSFYSVLHDVDSILFLSEQMESGVVLDLTLSQKIVTLLKNLSSLCTSWYDFVQGGSPEPGCPDPTMEQTEQRKDWHRIQAKKRPR